MVRTIIALLILIVATFFAPIWLQGLLYVACLFIVRYRLVLIIPAIIADAWYAPEHHLTVSDNKMLLLVLGMVALFTVVVRTTRISQRYGLEKK